MKHIFGVVGLLCALITVRAQPNDFILSESERQEIIEQLKAEITDSLKAEKQQQRTAFKKAFGVSGYAEVYYSFDLSNPKNHQRQPFLYSHNRHNEVNLNFGLIQLQLNHSKVRGNIALMAGTYSNENLAHEPRTLRNIFEANMGVKISSRKNLWLDAGIFSSHIGFESAIGADCWNLTRSMLADNSPYYESGAKVSYTSDNEKWLLSGLILNGWQRIQRLPGNQLPAFGHQITFTASDKFLLNSSSFIGNDFPESERRMRYFHNLYAQMQWHKKIGCIVGFDIGAQQTHKHSKVYDVWFSPVLIMRYTPTLKSALSFRAEYYSDDTGVIIAVNSPNGFQTFGYSFNFDYSILENLMWRIEGRTFVSKDEIFMLKEMPSRFNYFLTTAFALSF